MQKHESAFTLIELMITITVAAVVLTLGVPSFGRIMERNQLSANINSIVSTLHFARSEAIKRNSNVEVCHSANGLNCGGAGYEDGWITFIDLNGDGDYADVDEELIRTNEGLPNNYTMRTNNLDIFRYNSKGASKKISGAIATGRIILCKDNQLTKSRAIFISNNGRTRLAPLDSNGVPEESPGNPITTCNP